MEATTEQLTSSGKGTESDLRTGSKTEGITILTADPPDHSTQCKLVSSTYATASPTKTKTTDGGTCNCANDCTCLEDHKCPCEKKAAGTSKTTDGVKCTGNTYCRS